MLIQPDLLIPMFRMIPLMDLLCICVDNYCTTGVMVNDVMTLKNGCLLKGCVTFLVCFQFK